MDTFEPACIIWPGVKIQTKVKFIYSTLFLFKSTKIYTIQLLPSI